MDPGNKEKCEGKNIYGPVVSALILAVAFTLPVLARESLDKIAAVVNGDIVLYSEVRERQFQINATERNSSFDDRESMRLALDSLVEEKLVIQYGKEKDIKVASFELDQAVNEFKTRAEAQGADIETLLNRAGLTMERYRSMMKDQLIARKVMQTEVRSQVQINEEGVKEYYKEHLELFTDRPKIRVSHILKFLPKDATEGDSAHALDEIKAIRNKIVEGLDFTEAAKTYSEDPSRDKGGDLGEVVQGEMVEEFEKAAFSLAPGAVSEPVRTRYGYHLIRVGYKAAPAVAPLEKVRAEIENRIYAELLQTVRDDWMKRLKKEALIDIKLQLD